MLVLSQRDVARLFTMERALAAVRAGAAAYSSGRAEVPVRLRLEIPEAGAEMLVMPGYLPDEPALGLKVVSAYPGNPGRGLHVSPGVLLLLDARTGRAAALLDATNLTDVRTGAMTGVACEYLARPDAAVLGLLGTGAQARTQLDAIAAVRPLGEVRVWSRSAERRERFVEEARQRHPRLEIVAAPSAEAAVIGADIAVAATTAAEPAIPGAWVAPGMLVCGVGSHTPGAAELAPEVAVMADRVVVDTRRGGLHGAGDLLGPLNAGRLAEASVNELGELVLGRVPGRQRPEEIAVFKSVGFAAVDLAAAVAVVRAALTEGLGQTVDLHDEDAARAAAGLPGAPNRDWST